MEIARNRSREKQWEEREIKRRKENHVSNMQTDIRMTILFYRNAILLKYLRKKKDRERYRLFYANSSGFRNVRNFLIVQSLCSLESSWYRQQRGADSQSITIKWKQSSCTFMINITQYSQHNIQIPLHSWYLCHGEGDSETYNDRARYDKGWYKKERM